MTYTAPPTRSRIQDERQEDFRKKQMSDLLARQQAEKDYTRTGQIKPGPQLGFTGSGVGGGLGNWASQFAGSKIGGGLGSMLFGPWGALLGAMFGRGVGKRGWQARQTKEKESLRDILMPTFAQGLFGNKINQPSTGGEGIQTIDIRDKIYQKDPGAVGIENKFADDLSGIEGQEAKLKDLALAQYRVLQKKQGMQQFGGEKMTPKDKQFLDILEKRMKEEKMYSIPLIG
jgi:hypothetical protein